MQSGSRVRQTVEADTTVNSTDEDLIGKTDENIVSLSNNSKRSMALVDTENNSVGEHYFPPLKRFQICSPRSQYEWSLSEDMLSYMLKMLKMLKLMEASNPIPTQVMCHLPPLLMILERGFGRKS